MITSLQDVNLTVKVWDSSGHVAYLVDEFNYVFTDAPGSARRILKLSSTSPQKPNSRLVYDYYDKLAAKYISFVVLV